MSDKKTDPTKDPEFQKVVRRMLHTPPKPRKPKKDKSEHAKMDNSCRRPAGRRSDQD